MEIGIEPFQDLDVIFQVLNALLNSTKSKYIQ